MTRKIVPLEVFQPLPWFANLLAGQAKDKLQLIGVPEPWGIIVLLDNVVAPKQINDIAVYCSRSFQPSWVPVLCLLPNIVGVAQSGRWLFTYISITALIFIRFSCHWSGKVSSTAY